MGHDKVPLRPRRVRSLRISDRMRRQVLLRTQASNLFGWGVFGLNLLQCWASDPDMEPLLEGSIARRHLPSVDPLRLNAIWKAAIASNAFVDQLNAGNIDLQKEGVVVIHALGNGLGPPTRLLGGVRNIGRCIFENTRVKSSQQLATYDSLVCGSRWGADILRSLSDKPVAMIHEGIDPALFFPGPRSGLLDPGRFYIFSGGKIELRKAHDLVILAFREFASRHPDAVLVATWSSPWAQEGFQGKLRAPLRRAANGALDIKSWIAENEVPLDQFIELPQTPNHLMPFVLREMDCALQVSRCEACTNLPAKEAMACGVPVILANNTGTRDLIDVDNCIALNAQGPVSADPGWGTDGWGESSVDEIVAALETLYTDTQLRMRIAARGAAWILEHRRTWADHAAALKSHVLGLL